MTKPFIKWVGGKSRLLAQLAPLLPDASGSGRYFEPFVGGGAMFFATRPRRAVLSDVNASLHETYEAVRSEVEDVLAELQPLAAGHCRARYYEVRALYNRAGGTRSRRAAMFIYLNRTGYNGLHRLNARGQFNVPAGDLDGPFEVDESVLRSASVELQRAKLCARSFDDVLREARADDFVYLDPPYEPTHGARNFTRYNGREFGTAQQELLRDVIGQLDRRGCRFMLSNSDTVSNRQRYRAFNIRTIHAPRSVNCAGTGRGLVSELVVRNY